MAFYRTGGGGSASETVLWTNGSPTASFASQDVTLSQSMDNFKSLGMYCRFSTTDATEYYAEIETSKLAYDKTVGGQFVAICVRRVASGSGQIVVRNAFRPQGSTDPTKLTVGGCITQTNGTGAIYNTLLIPTQIVGIN